MSAVQQLFINILLVVILSTTQIRSEINEVNVCISKTQCNECIQTPSCAWCLEPAETFGDYPRCYQPATQSQHKSCPPQHTYNPNNELRINVNQPLSTLGVSEYDNNGNLVRLSPQKVGIKLKPGNSNSVRVKYAEVEDYPVDLYFLMDLSKSMEDDKEKMIFLGNQLVSTLENLTSNFHIGFGSFVHKLVTPNASKLNAPCTNCTAPYGFIHNMQLSKESRIFSEILNRAELSNNLNAPAGVELDQFNAIMQAIVCKEQIGWRQNARKILVVVTNDGFPNTTTRPNDYVCHTRSDGFYGWITSATENYLNISELNSKVTQDNINIIFAITPDQFYIYDKLKNHIDGSFSGILSSDSSNIIEMVKHQYEQITSTIEMKDMASEEVVVNYYSKCLNSTSDENQTNICSQFRTGQVIDFRVEVVLKECPKDPRKWRQTIQVYPVGVPDKLIIDLEMLCSCPELN